MTQVLPGRAILPEAMTNTVRSLVAYGLAGGVAWSVIRQCRKPTGWLGRLMVGIMNRSHSDLTAWGLEHVKIGSRDTVLDVGCGGGRTVHRLASLANLGKAHGVDYSEASVAVSRGLNKVAIEAGRVAIQKASVSQLPFPNDQFDLVTAVETHYYWPDRPADLREIHRVLKPGGRLLIIAETYRGSRFDMLQRSAMKLIGGSHLSADEHRELLAQAGYADVQVFFEPKKGWICVSGRKAV